MDEELIGRFKDISLAIEEKGRKGIEDVFPRLILHKRSEYLRRLSESGFTVIYNFTAVFSESQFVLGENTLMRIEYASGFDIVFHQREGVPDFFCRFMLTPDAAAQDRIDSSLRLSCLIDKGFWKFGKGIAA